MIDSARSVGFRRWLGPRALRRGGAGAQL